MTRERFEALAEAYGAAIPRWPAEERAAAQAWLAAEPEAGRAILARAEALDAALDAWRPMTASHALRERVIAAAPRAIRGAIRWTWVWGAGAGAGLCAATAAGLVMGVALYGQVAVAQADEPVSSVMTSYEIPVLAEPTEAQT
jgi:hypothetical protein